VSENFIRLCRSLFDAKTVYLLKNMLRVVVRMNTDVYQQNYKAVMLITTGTGTVLMGKGENMMVDREKVIGHLYDCLAASRPENMWVFVRKDIIGDALAILKEQQKLIDEITQRRANNGALD